ncbi:histone-lysine N-methyltransferase [Ignicoccus islandicus DSM 13165]|uniref:Histone-lysine N-methyltransferase n=1 Tax=Ignicoccus islandicus DSM 13165 TaxID=940295 RepID=A0A0U3E8S1_9CREN|nr:2-isopropylmalate synthase [Ignicoccus islandicus]ALU11758.1 histone-lysine N-methyltransferase [Ignicoccus islandicus DSM 13165]
MHVASSLRSVRSETLRRLKEESIDTPDYEVIDAPKPELYKFMFPFKSAPRIFFDGIILHTELPKEIWITDTTFRDGQQAREPYTVEQMVQLYKYLHELSGPNCKVLTSEFFLYTEKDRKAVREIKNLGYNCPKVTAWIRANKEELKLVKEAGIEETGILSSISDYHIYFKFKSSRRKVIDKYLSVVEEALKMDIVPRVHLEDITRANVFEVVVPFVKKLMKLSEKYGLPVKVRYPDTLGVGVPLPEAMLPRSIPKLTWVLRHVCGVPSKWLEFHGHNDFHLGVANAMSAWLYGAALNNGTLLGIGERAGNVPIEALVFIYAQLKHGFDGMNTKVIKEIAEYYRKELGYEVPPYYPIVGRNFATTRAGIHADGLLKNPETYLPFDPEELLGVKPGIAITPYAGLAGIVYWINKTFELKDDEKVDKKDPRVQEIYRDVMKQFEHGRLTALSDLEMLMLVKKHMPDLVEKYLDRLPDDLKIRLFSSNSK